MPIREEPFVNGEYYHIYNRGVAKLPVFLKHRHYLRFERTINYYSYYPKAISFSHYLRLKMVSNITELDKLHKFIPNQLVELICYCLMPNHFHFILKQVADNGISNFMRNLGNSYTKYFNVINNRVGPVFQGRFKAIHIESEYYLKHLSRYIHINPIEAGICDLQTIIDYPYSSLSQYVSNSPAGTLICKPKIILDQFGKGEFSYSSFCQNLADYGSTVSSLKKLTLDIDQLPVLV